MKSMIIFLSGLIQVVTCYCEDSFLNGWTDNTGAEYDEECTELASRGSEHTTRALRNEYYAICLLQRNSIMNLIDNCGWEETIFRHKVQRGSLADRLQLLDGEVVSSYPEDDQDGWAKYTPKDVLLTVAESDRCKRCDIARKIRDCPFNDRQQFKACLCCERVDDVDILCLHDCLYEEKDDVYKESKKPPNFSCKATCPLYCLDNRRSQTECHNQCYYLIDTGITTNDNWCPNDNSPRAVDKSDDGYITLTETTYSQVPSRTERSTTYSFSTASAHLLRSNTTTTAASITPIDPVVKTNANPAPTTSTSFGVLIYSRWKSIVAAMCISLAPLLD